MRLISFLLRASRRNVFLAVVAGSIAGLSNTGLLAIINAAVNNPRLSKLTLAADFIGLSILTLSCRVIADALISRVSQRSIFNLRMQLSRQILNAPLSHLEKVGAARILTSLTDDVSAIANALAGIPPFFMNIATLTGCLIYLGWLSWQMLLGLLGFMIVGVLSYQFLMNRAMRYFALVREHGDMLYQHFRGLTQGTKELKIHHRRREAFLNDKLRSTAAALQRYTVAGSTVLAAAMGWGQLLIFIFVGLLLFAVHSSDIRTMIGFTLVTIFLMTPIESILNTFSSMGRANIAMKKVEGLGVSLSTHLTDASPVFKAGKERTWTSLELIGVTHDYKKEGEENNFRVGPLNLSFRVGELVFLVGGNGSGKTTFVKVFTGLYLPENGEIRLDGKLVTDKNREDYRQLFAVVFSDFFLFESLLGLHVATLDAKAQEYLIQLHLDHKVQVSNGVLSTTDLSQGQRKRLALLTAYLEDRPIYVFDEWAADQDPVFKEVFYCKLLPELKAKGKMVLVISHDDHYYHVADRIIKMDDGKIEYDKRVAPLHQGSTSISDGSNSISVNPTEKKVA